MIKVSGPIPFMINLYIEEEDIQRIEKKLQDLEIKEKIKSYLIEYIIEDVEKVQRPKKPWYRKERW